MTPATVTPIVPTSDAICGLLTILSGGVADDAARLMATARTLNGASEHLHLGVGPRREFYDVPILSLLEADHALQLGLAVRSTDGYDAIRLHALAATWTFPRVHQNGVLSMPTGALTAAGARVTAFVIRPTMVVVGGTRLKGGGYTLTALYQLTRPLDVVSPADQARARTLLRRLAAALGAPDLPADVDLGDLTVPVPGALILEGRGDDHVTCHHCDPAHHVSLEDLERSLPQEDKK